VLHLQSTSLLNQLLARVLNQLLVCLLNLHSVLPLRLVSLLSQLLEHLLQSAIPQSLPLEHLPLWALLVAPVLEQRVEWETKHRRGERLHNPPSQNPIPFRPLLVARPGLPSLEVLEGQTPFRALEVTTPRKPAQDLHHLDKGNRSLALRA
jgi:hypothetical protein